jgi:hypothetical protein
MTGVGSAGSDEPNAVFVAAIALFLGAFTQSALHWTRIPNSVLLLVSTLAAQPKQLPPDLLLRRKYLPLSCCLQLWGLAIGVGNGTYVSSWQHVSPGITFWQVSLHRVYHQMHGNNVSLIIPCH